MATQTETAVTVGVGSLDRGPIDALERKCREAGISYEREDGKVPFNDKNPNRHAGKPVSVLKVKAVRSVCCGFLGSASEEFLADWLKGRRAGVHSSDRMWWAS